MEEKKLNKIEVNKIWDAMIEAEVITKPADRKEAKKQYNIKDELKTTKNHKIHLLKRTVLFFYDKYDVMRKHYRQKLNDKQKIMNELTENIETLKRQNASLEYEVKSLKARLLEESEANHKYKTANKVLNQRLEEKKNEVKPEPDRVDCYGMSACIVKGEIVDYDE